MKTKRLCEEAERLSSDRISTLPQPILDTILCLLPTTEEAAMTSILSREWRYKWTTIPKLEFSHNKPNSEIRCKCCYEIHQILSLHQGPIHDLTLRTYGGDCLEFDQIILHLSTNHTVKKLSVSGSDKLPVSVFSFRQLTDLDICGIDLDDPPIFNGFGSVGSLCLRCLSISTKTLLRLLSNSPSLKSLSLFLYPPDPDDKCTINELFKCLPAIEQLTTWRHDSQWLVLHPVPRELPPSLIHLKYFCFEEMCFVDGYRLSFLLVLIKCSPNLEKIKLQNDWCHLCDEEFVVWEDYSNVWLEHLNELEIESFGNYKPEMEFVKFILARSPKLKKVRLVSDVEPNQESEMLKTLLWAPRASPAVITIE